MDGRGEAGVQVIVATEAMAEMPNTAVAPPSASVAAIGLGLLVALALVTALPLATRRVTQLSPRCLAGRGLVPSPGIFVPEQPMGIAMRAIDPLAPTRPAGWGWRVLATATRASEQSLARLRGRPKSGRGHPRCRRARRPGSSPTSWPVGEPRSRSPMWRPNGASVIPGAGAG